MISDIDISKFRKVDGGLLLVMRELLAHGSVTRSAQSLNLSQSAISHSLARLRTLFDDPLFIRRPHGLEPTQKALALGPQIEALIDLAGETLGMGQSFEPSTSVRTFTLSAPEFVTVVTATPLLDRISQNAPAAGVGFLHLPEQEAFEQLRRGNIDAAIGRFEHAPWPDTTLAPLYEDEWCVVGRRGHAAFKGQMTEHKYKACTHIWANSESETTPADATFDYSNFKGSVVPRWLSALVIAARSEHIATCPRRLAESQADLFDLDIKPVPFDPSPIFVSIAYRSAQRDKGTAWFIEQIQSLF